MTNRLISTLDKIPTGTRMSIAIVCDGLCLAKTENGIFHQRPPKPVGYAWSVTAPCGTTVFAFPDAKAKLFEDQTPIHLRIDIRKEAE